MVNDHQLASSVLISIHFLCYWKGKFVLSKLTNRIKEIVCLKLCTKKEIDIFFTLEQVKNCGSPWGIEPQTFRFHATVLSMVFLTFFLLCMACSVHNSSIPIWSFNWWSSTGSVGRSCFNSLSSPVSGVRSEIRNHKSNIWDQERSEDRV